MEMKDEFDKLWHDGKVPYGSVTSSFTRPTGHIRLTIEKGDAEAYIGVNGKEILFNKFYSDQGRGHVTIGLEGYASIHHINIKTRWQQLILDTQDSFNYRDRIKEGGLLYDHYPKHRVKHIASEVVDAKGFLNNISLPIYYGINNTQKVVEVLNHIHMLFVGLVQLQVILVILELKKWLEDLLLVMHYEQRLIFQHKIIIMVKLMIIFIISMI